MAIDTAKETHSGTQNVSRMGGQWTAHEPQQPLPVTLEYADHLIEQYLTLGISHTEAVRLLQLACSALNHTMKDLDSRAFSAAPMEVQISILLPRLDIGHLADMVGISLAQVQSAVAMLTQEYVLHRHLPD